MENEGHLNQKPESLEDSNRPLPYRVRRGVWVTDLRTVGSAIAAMGLEEAVRNGQTVEIPSLGITLTAEHLTNKEE